MHDAPLTVVSVFQQASTNSANVTAIRNNVTMKNCPLYRQCKALLKKNRFVGQL